MLAAPGNPLPSSFQGSCLRVLVSIALGHSVNPLRWPMRIMFRTFLRVKLPAYGMCPMCYRPRATFLLVIARMNGYVGV